MRNLAVLLSGQGRTAEAESRSRYADAIDARQAVYQQPSGYQRTGYQGQPPHAGAPLGWIMVAFWALVAFGAALPDET